MANLADIIPAFMVGPNGQRLTPEQIRERQQIAQSLMGQATDTSPNAGGVASILAKGVQGFAAGRARNQADAAVGANGAVSKSNIEKMYAALNLGGSAQPVGQGATVASPMVAPVQGVSVPQTADASYIRSGLIERGLPEHVADGFLVNFQDESGLNPGINEANPIVPGSRGGFGLYQLTGPRRVAYEQFASQKGVDPSNVDAQLDFLMQEGQGSERGAFEKILAAPDTATAAQTIVNDFLRPSPEHAQSRSSRYASLNGGAQPVAQTPMQTAQAAPAINPAVIEALSSPYASEQERSVAGLLLNQQMSQQQAAQKQAMEQQQRQQEIARRQQIAQQAGINPQYAMDDDLWKGATGNVFAAPSTSTVGGAVIDNRTGQPIYQAPAQNFRQITGPDAAALGLDPAKAYNVGPDGKVAPIGDAGVTVNNNMGGDKFGEEFAKLDAKALDTVATSGQAAQRNLGRINQLGELLKSSPTGFEGAVAQRAGEWGIPTKGLDTLQAAQAAINSLVPEQRQPGSGPMSDADLALFKQSLPRIINQPGGNDLIINTMKSIAQYDAEGANIVQQLRSGKLDRAKAFEALQNRVNPLDSFKVPGAPAENPMPNQQQPQTKRRTSSGIEWSIN